MKNSKMFVNAHALFNEVKFNETKAALERIVKNFNLVDDELFFEITACLHQPHLQISEQLEAKRQGHLIAEKFEDRVFVKHQWEIKTRIDVSRKYGKIKHVCSIRIDSDGEIAAITANQTNKEQMKEAKKLVENWLNKEFGVCDDDF